MNQPTEISKRLRVMAALPSAGSRVSMLTVTVERKLLTVAADEIERYYSGMLAWKRTAEAKDAEFRQQPKYESVSDHNGKVIGVRMANPEDMMREVFKLDTGSQVHPHMALPSRTQEQWKALHGKQQTERQKRDAFEAAIGELFNDVDLSWDFMAGRYVDDSVHGWFTKWSAR